VYCVVDYMASTSTLRVHYLHNIPSQVRTIIVPEVPALYEAIWGGFVQFWAISA